MDEWGFSAGDDDSEFRCSVVDGGQFSANRWFDCRSPYTSLELEDTTYTFGVQARTWHPEATYIRSEYSTPVARTFSVRGTFGSRFASFVVVGGKRLRSARRKGIRRRGRPALLLPLRADRLGNAARKQARALGLRRRIGAGRIT